jgi:hypothetical protein
MGWLGNATAAQARRPTCGRGMEMEAFKPCPELFGPGLRGRTRTTPGVSPKRQAVDEPKSRGTPILATRAGCRCVVRRLNPTGADPNWIRAGSDLNGQGLIPVIMASGTLNTLRAANALSRSWRWRSSDAGPTFAIPGAETSFRSGPLELPWESVHSESAIIGPGQIGYLTTGSLRSVPGHAARNRGFADQA